MITVGEFLRKLREEKKISLDEVSRETNIRLSYLQAIEDDAMEKIPSMPQAKGFARLYAAHLGFSSRDLFEEIDRLNHPVPEISIESPTEANESNEATLSPVEPEKLRKKIFKGAQEEISEGRAAEPETEAPSVSQLIFREIGLELKTQREALGLSLEDVERLTKIREPFIYALESGSIDDLPSTVQGRGMLNNYASFLTMNADALQGRYAEGLQQRRQEKFATDESLKKEGIKVMGKEPLTGWRRFLTTDLLVGGFVFITLFSLVIWGALKMINISVPEVEPTISSISEILVGGKTMDAALTNAPGAGEPSATPEPTRLFNLPQDDIKATISAVEAAPIQLVIVAFQRTYLRVTVDGVETFSGRIVPGNVYTYTGSNKIAVLAGNAAAMQIFFNQVDAGILGPMGQVLEMEFTRQEMVTPTPRFSPTPTLTQAPTLTALPTQTLMPTATVPTATLTPALPPGP